MDGFRAKILGIAGPLRLTLALAQQDLTKVQSAQDVESKKATLRQIKADVDGTGGTGHADHNEWAT